MNHLILLALCLFIVEIFIWSNYITLINSLIAVMKKAIHTILNKNISDHWKEKMIPQYSKNMIVVSLNLLSIILPILSFLLLIKYLHVEFFEFLFSLKGIFASMIFGFGYLYFRNTNSEKI